MDDMDRLLRSRCWLHEPQETLPASPHRPPESSCSPHGFSALTCLGLACVAWVAGLFVGHTITGGLLVRERDRNAFLTEQLADLRAAYGLPDETPMPLAGEGL